MSFLEINELTVTYKNSPKPCIDNLNLSVEEGEILVILGSSGCGKSTLLKVISGLLKQESGTITVDGTEISPMSPEKRPVSMVFQKALMFKNMTVGQNVNYAPRVNGTMDKEEMSAKTEQLLELVELKGYADKKSSQLSGGQEQRVSLARALMTEPKVLLLDEPLSALDATLRVSMREAIRDICKKLNQTVIFVTHDQQEAVAIADRIALMKNGQITQCSIPSEFYTNPKSVSVARFFGWKNFIPGKIEGGIVTCSIGRFAVKDMHTSGEDVILAIRPEAIICYDDGEFEGTVIRSTYMGATSDYTLRCKDVELFITVNSREMFVKGETMRFNIDSNMLCAMDVEEEAPVPEMTPKKKPGLFGKLKHR